MAISPGLRHRFRVGDLGHNGALNDGDRAHIAITGASDGVLGTTTLCLYDAD